MFRIAATRMYWAFAGTVAEVPAPNFALYIVQVVPGVCMSTPL